MKPNFRNDEYVEPPGSLTQILSHPFHKISRSVELSIFNDHRYAFFFWNKWTQKLIESDSINYPPCLISLDWHQDLVYPTPTEKGWLRNLNVLNNKDVALYAWANLRSLNDTHILSAAYLNLIGDIYVHCRQGSFDSDWDDEIIVDRHKNKHAIKKFKEYDELATHLLKSKENNIYFDIDLDFFTLNNPLQTGEENDQYTYLSEVTIREMLISDNHLMKWILPRLQGITIAQEPQHTGGLLESNRLLNVINKTWFEPSLFTTYPGQWDKDTQWKHLR